MTTVGCCAEGAGYSVEEAIELEPGDNICVRMLQSRPDLTGRLGMVVGSFNPVTGRIAVQLEDEDAPMALKPHALEGSGLPDGVRRVFFPKFSSVLNASAETAAPAASKAPAASTAKRRRVSSKSNDAGDGHGVEGDGRRGDERTTDQEEALFARVYQIVSKGDLNTMTLRAVRQKLLNTESFSSEFVAENKSLIKRMVTEAISQLQRRRGLQQKQSSGDKMLERATNADKILAKK